MLLKLSGIQMHLSKAFENFNFNQHRNLFNLIEALLT